MGTVTTQIRRAVLLGLLSLAIVTAMSACGNGTGAVPIGAATPGPNGHYKIGQAAPIGAYTVTVKRIFFPKTLPGSPPQPGMKFLVLDLIIQTSDTNVDRISPAAQFVVKDAKGTSFPLDADVTPTTDFSTTQLPSEIPALGSIHGEIAYQVPQDATDLRLLFNPSFLESLIGHGKQLTIDLQ